MFDIWQIQVVTVELRFFWQWSFDSWQIEVVTFEEAYTDKIKEWNNYTLGKINIKFRRNRLIHLKLFYNATCS